MDENDPIVEMSESDLRELVRLLDKLEMNCVRLEGILQRSIQLNLEVPTRQDMLGFIQDIGNVVGAMSTAIKGSGL